MASVGYGLEAWSLLFPAILLIFLIVQQKMKTSLFLKLIFLGFVGMGFDGLMAHFGGVHFQSAGAWSLPFWMISIWLLFVLLLPWIQSFFDKRLLLASGLGFIFGPLSYYSGVSLEVLRLSTPTVLVVYGIFWSLYFPLSIYGLRRRK